MKRSRPRIGARGIDRRGESVLKIVIALTLAGALTFFASVFVHATSSASVASGRNAGTSNGHSSRMELAKQHIKRSQLIALGSRRAPTTFNVNGRLRLDRHKQNVPSPSRAPLSSYSPPAPSHTPGTTASSRASENGVSHAHSCSAPGSDSAHCSSSVHQYAPVQSGFSTTGQSGSTRITPPSNENSDARRPTDTIQQQQEQQQPPPNTNVSGEQSDTATKNQLSIRSGQTYNGVSDNAQSQTHATTTAAQQTGGATSSPSTSFAKQSSQTGTASSSRNSYLGTTQATTSVEQSPVQHGGTLGQTGSPGRNAQSLHDTAYSGTGGTQTTAPYHSAGDGVSSVSGNEDTSHTHFSQRNTDPSSSRAYSNADERNTGTASFESSGSTGGEAPVAYSSASTNAAQKAPDTATTGASTSSTSNLPSKVENSGTQSESGAKGAEAASTDARAAKTDGSPSQYTTVPNAQGISASEQSERRSSDAYQSYANPSSTSSESASQIGTLISSTNEAASSASSSAMPLLVTYGTSSMRDFFEVRYSSAYNA